jgi:hypothetical protein
MARGYATPLRCVSERWIAYRKTHHEKYTADRLLRSASSRDSILRLDPPIDS